MVDYDSIIPPGQVGKLTPLVKTEKLNNGSFSKSIKVITNAKNREIIHLTIRGRMLSAINMDQRFVRLKPDEKGNIEHTFTFSSEKDNLVFSSVSFNDRKNKTPSWQSGSISFPKLTVKKSDTPDKEGYYVYSVKMSMNMLPEKTLSGDFVFATNHPEKEKLEIRGIIIPADAAKKN